MSKPTKKTVLANINASILDVSDFSQQNAETLAESNNWTPVISLPQGQNTKQRTDQLVKNLKSWYKLSKRELTGHNLDTAFSKITTAINTFGDFVTDTIETDSASVTKELLEAIDDMIIKMGSAVLSFIKKFISIKSINANNYTEFIKTCGFIGTLHWCIACGPNYMNDPVASTWLGSIYSVLKSRVEELKNQGTNVQIGTFPIFSV